MYIDFQVGARLNTLVLFLSLDIQNFMKDASQPEFQGKTPKVESPIQVISETEILEGQDPYIGKVFGGCRLIGRVGSGGVGVVYLAKHLRLERPVAVKLLAKGLETQEDIRQRFLLEGRILAQLEHPNIVRIYDLGEEHHQLYLILHFIDGETLETRLRTRGKLSEIESVNIFLHVLSGLSHVHQNGLVHRDLKPQNIMLGQDNNVFLMDFNVAQISSLPFRLTLSGTVLGTPYFMAPEQIEGKHGDLRMDLYAVGMSMYVSMTGTHPFFSETLIETIKRQLNEDALPPENIDEELTSIIMQLIRRNPEERPKNCEEVIESLSHWVAKYRKQQTKAYQKPLPPPYLSSQKISAHLEQAFCENEDFTFLQASNLKLVEKIRTLTQIGPYRLEKEMGEGQWGVVYRVRHIEDNQVYAMKILTRLTDSNALERFHQEIAACAKLSHPNIVQFKHFSSERGLHYFVMEYVDGVPLSKKISDLSLSIRDSLRIIQDCLKGLMYAHSKGVLHRDIKPENILLDSHLNPKLADFGIARDLTLENVETRITQEGVILGTPAYMPVEQVMGLSDRIDFRSDLYSITACLYEMVTNHHPFEASNMQQLFYRICNREPALPSRLNPEVHRDLDTILIKGLSKDKRLRYQRAEELARDVGRFLNGLPILARPAPLSFRLKKWAQQNKGLTISIPIFIFLFCWSLILFYQQAKTNRETREQAAQLFHQRIRDRADIIDKYLIRFQTATRTQAALAKFFLQQKILSKEPPLMAKDFEQEMLAPKDYQYSEVYRKKISLLEPAFRLAPGLDLAKHQDLMSALLNVKFNFHQLYQSGLEFRWAYLALKEGVLLLYPGTGDISNSFDPRQRPWYLQASQAEDLLWVLPYEDAEAQGMTLTCAVAIRDGNNLLGVSCLDITEETIQKQLLSFRLPFSSERILYNSQGERVAFLKDSTFTPVNPFPLPPKDSNSLRFLKQGGESYVISYCWIDTLEWYFIVIARESDILRAKI